MFGNVFASPKADRKKSSAIADLSEDDVRKCDLNSMQVTDDAVIEEDPVPGMVSIFVSSSEEDRQILQNALNVADLEGGVIFLEKSASWRCQCRNPHVLVFAPYFNVFYMGREAGTASLLRRDAGSPLHPTWSHHQPASLRGGSEPPHLLRRHVADADDAQHLERAANGDLVLAESVARLRALRAELPVAAAALQGLPGQVHGEEAGAGGAPGVAGAGGAVGSVGARRALHRLA